MTDATGREGPVCYEADTSHTLVLDGVCAPETDGTPFKRVGPPTNEHLPARRPARPDTPLHCTSHRKDLGLQMTRNDSAQSKAGGP